MNINLFFCLFLSVFFLVRPVQGISSNDCSNGWREVDWKMVPFIELNARYFSYQFKIPKGQHLNFKISGKFPLARYFSFHSYNQETEDPISHITDFSITPNHGSVNPYQVGIDRYSTNRDFSLWVNASVEEDTDQQKLIIPFDESKDRLVDIWFRVYANESKELLLPTIQAFDGSLNPTSCPEVHQKEWSIATEPGPYDFRIPSPQQRGKVPLPFKNGEVHFFKPSTSSLGANLDNRYLSTRLDGKALFNPLTLKGRVERRLLKKNKAILNIGNISAVKLRVPSFPDTKSKIKYFTGEEDVRYWSLCLSDADTYTGACTSDSDAKTYLGEDGNKYAIFVFGPNDPLLKLKIESAGYNYLDHSEIRVPIIFLRQLLVRKGFEGNLEKVKSLTPEDAQNENGLWNFYGENEIGAFSPQGRQCWLTPNFIDTLCGLRESH